MVVYVLCATVFCVLQFQMLLCLMAFEIHKLRLIAERSKTGKFKEELFAKKLLDDSDTNLGDILAEFLRNIGIDKVEKSPLFFSATASMMAPLASTVPPSPTVLTAIETKNLESGSESGSPIPSELVPAIYMSPEKLQQIGAASTTPMAAMSAKQSSASLTANASSDSLGLIAMPMPIKPQDKIFPSSNHSRQAMMMRMDHLMDEAETAILQSIGAGSDVLAMLSAPVEDSAETRTRPLNKPVVIADAVPVPDQCPESVEQLLEAALAHHNLGSFQESLKFLEAARLQLDDIKKRAAAGDLKCLLPLSVSQNIYMYITVCKGNVYQSSGDDEQSMLQYMDGWYAAKAVSNSDWELVFLNCIGMLAYYNLRFDVGLMCFASVVLYRQTVCMCVCMYLD